MLLQEFTHCLPQRGEPAVVLKRETVEIIEALGAVYASGGEQLQLAKLSVRTV